jgi:nitrogen fixation/metabolism regulation signal transduction histidine kinase
MLVFLAATLIPVAGTLAITWRMLEYSLTLNAIGELDSISRSLEHTGKALYQNTREAMRAEVESMRLAPAKVYEKSDAAGWPPEVRQFVESNEPERFVLAGEKRDRVEYLVRNGDTVLVFVKPVLGPGMAALDEEYIRARATVERVNARNLRRGFIITLILLAASVWVVSLVTVLYLARRISQPMEQLTAGLSYLASGNLDARLTPHGSDEVAAAMQAFNHTAEQLQQSREKLVHVTRLESWQSLARKMAHEVKNSLTPIRLTMEEIVARKGERDEAFIEQAAQIVVDEVGTLQRRVRAFTEFASEPPVRPEIVDVNGLLEDRIAFLRTAHPEVQYDLRLEDGPLKSNVDPDLIKGVLTNLLENAAQAAGAGGHVLGKTAANGSGVAVEVHDSGPGLSEQARSTLFEPTISFKKAGMGLGLSIAKRAAMLVGGDILLVDGELGGAAFRLLLPRAEDNASTASAHS